MPLVTKTDFVFLPVTSFESAEEFYSVHRDVKVQDVKRDLSQRFKENGMLLADVLIRQYDYPQIFQIANQLITV